jgi:CRP/FNR family cyclic AMP-dependent transcriptional regulator
VVAIADCSLSFLSRAKFQTCLEAHPELTSYLMKTLARRLRQADDGLAATTFLSVKQRLARALLSVAEYVGEKNGGGRIQLRLKISQGDLAAMAGVARENVNRTMSEWRQRDIVTRSSNYYCINDPNALTRDMEADSSCSQQPDRIGRPPYSTYQ